MEEFQVDLALLGSSDMGMLPIQDADLREVRVWSQISSFASTSAQEPEKLGSGLFSQEAPIPGILPPEIDKPQNQDGQMIVVTARFLGGGGIIWGGYAEEDTGMDPNPGLSSEPGGSGGQASGEYSFYEDAACPDEAAQLAGKKITELVNTVGNFEYGVSLVRNSDGSYGAFNNTIHTDYDPDGATFPFPADQLGTLAGIVHNHPFEAMTDDTTINLQNRYPSPGDWRNATALVNPPDGRPGADPQIFSLYIVDSSGVMREFKYSDKAKYESLDKSQLSRGDNLPSETKGCES